MDTIILHRTGNAELDNDMLKVLNGAFKFIDDNGWLEGYRNNLTVDISIALSHFGWSIEHVNDLMRKCWKKGMIKDYDKVDFINRTNLIDIYINKYKKAPQLYMMMERYWKSKSIESFAMFKLDED